MKRRNFIKTTIGLLGATAVPGISRALAALCPPRTLAASGGGSVTTVCPMPTDSTLNSLINSLAPKQWAQLPATWSGGSNSFWKMSNASESILAYAHNGHYDPIRRKIFFVGCGYGNAGYVVYDEASNTWTSRQLSQNIIHIWDHSAYDRSRGILHFVHQLGRAAYQLNVDTGVVTSAPGPFNEEVDTFGFEYWPSLDCLIAISQHGDIRRRSAQGSWTDFGKAVWSTGYHSMAAYDHIRNVMYFGGGNGNERSFFQLSNSGASVRLPDAPQNIYVSSSVGLCDPVSGNYVLRQTGDSSSAMSEYVPGSGWQSINTTPPAYLRGKRGSMGVALTGHASGRGIYMYVAVSDSQASSAEVWLYRHS